MIRRLPSFARALTLAMLCALALAIPASAQVCRGAVDSLNFGSIDLTANVNYDTSGTVHVTCSGTAGQTVRVCSNIGAGTGGQDASGNPRYMVNGGNLLGYNLYQDAPRSTVWGTYAGPGSALAIDVALDASGTGHATVPIYGRVPSGQGALPAVVYQSVFAGAASSYFAYAYSTGQSCAAIATTNQTAAALTVTANDTNSCTISAGTLNFGNISSTASPVDASSDLIVNCSTGTGYTVGLNGGLSGASNPTQRIMQFGVHQLTYGLYRDNQRSQPWGDTTGAGGNVVSGTGDGTSHNITVYGRIAAQATPAAGTYQDYVIATVTY